ncbi:amidohydrolase [Aurantiacibacter atlanticus]|uniref:Amidohydrolase n=1 Tax=Aurantiacibacter atlanticus TaxID=1648404 RepID=A0A0H4VE40_9SPHN|nr:amidohydrolase [Aurantiacibacter atlanticus]AKQ42957.1 amidohydrolase [Aurantiacibacter atlanticus]MDF1834340.1 amidohydrolase [Alteraurantiacibacter sp. bin_em_oilr2.035]
MKTTKTIKTAVLSSVAALSLLASNPAAAEAPEALKTEAMATVDTHAELVQEMVDSMFSFAEPGFQEFKTQEYVTGILEEAGFTIELGSAGIPSAWTATWTHGTGGPKVALGSDVDALLGLSQQPGTGEIAPLVEGAPGHGEGHNSGMAVMVAAALAVKDIMQEHDIDGTLMIWPGIAEELLATKAYYVRAGMFDGFDACLFTHVSTDFSTTYGEGRGNGMVSVEYNFSGKTAHGAGAPWLGRSALDGVELMNVAWNMRREHLPISQRSHYVITDGGGQPNIVPGTASVWYYFRDHTFDGVSELFDIGNTIAQAAADATGTTVERRTLGYAAPQWGNRPLAEAAFANIEQIGMPSWSSADQAFARLVQETNDREIEPLGAEILPMEVDEDFTPTGGGSDDIGDIMWALPTITIRFPSNVPNVIGHHVTAAMPMATPIAHKGAVAGAKAVALTTLDILMDPELLADANRYREEVQFADGREYAPVLTEADMPAIDLNGEIMQRMRPQMEPYYYDPSRYSSYLEQLGVAYPPTSN